MKPLMRLEDVCSFLRVEPDDVRGWIKRGTIPAPFLLAEDLWRWKREVIEAWVELVSCRFLNPAGDARSRPPMTESEVLDEEDLGPSAVE